MENLPTRNRYLLRVCACSQKLRYNDVIDICTPLPQIHDFANVTLAMSDGFDRVVPSPSWGLLCFALPGNFNVYLERIEVQREKLALSFDLQRQNLFFETNGRERSLCSLGLRQRSTQEKQVSKRRLKYFSLTE